MWKNGNLLEETSRIDLCKLGLKKTDVYVNTDVWNKKKLISYGDLTLKPIGYIPSEENDISVFSEIMTYENQYVYPDRKNGYNLFYEECTRNGCKVTDFFLCVDDGRRGLIGEILLPVNFGLISIIKEKFLFV